MPYADPDQQRAANKECARRKRARQRGTEERCDVGPLMPKEMRLRTIANALDVLELAFVLLREDDIPRSRTLIQLGGAVGRIVQAAELERRVAELEVLVDARNQNETP